jgi:hypothetical protein
MIYIAIILSDYQELNLKRFIDYSRIKEKIINIRFYIKEIDKIKLPQNVIRKVFSSSFAFKIYFFIILLKYFFYKKKFIFGDVTSKSCSFLSKFIEGKNIIYVDDGSGSLSFDYNQLKKNCLVFTPYRIKLPKKLKKIYDTQKYINKKKIFSNKILFVGKPLVSRNVLSRDKFIKMMKIVSKENKNFYYYPHRFDDCELSLLPKNFKIMKRKGPVEKFIFNYKYNFRLIYSFGSSCLISILNFYKKKNLKVLDITEWIENNQIEIRDAKILYKYYTKIKIDVKPLKKIDTYYEASYEKLSNN